MFINRQTEKHFNTFSAAERKGTTPDRLIRQKVGGDSEAL